MRLVADFFQQRRGQAGFADAGLTADQHDLPLSISGLLPAAHEQSDLFFASNGDLAQLWVAPEARRRGIGARLLQTLRERCAAPNGLRVLNVDSRAADVRAFLERSGFERFITQHEMELPLV